MGQVSVYLEKQWKGHFLLPQANTRAVFSLPQLKTSGEKTSTFLPETAGIVYITEAKGSLWNDGNDSVLLAILFSLTETAGWLGTALYFNSYKQSYHIYLDHWRTLREEEGRQTSLDAATSFNPPPQLHWLLSLKQTNKPSSLRQRIGQPRISVTEAVRHWLSSSDSASDWVAHSLFLYKKRRGKGEEEEKKKGTL